MKRSDRERAKVTETNTGLAAPRACYEYEVAELPGELNGERLKYLLNAHPEWEPFKIFTAAKIVKPSILHPMGSSEQIAFIVFRREKCLTRDPEAQSLQS